MCWRFCRQTKPGSLKLQRSMVQLTLDSQRGLKRIAGQSVRKRGNQYANVFDLRSIDTRICACRSPRLIRLTDAVRNKPFRVESILARYWRGESHAEIDVSTRPREPMDRAALLSCRLSSLHLCGSVRIRDGQLGGELGTRVKVSTKAWVRR